FCVSTVWPSRWAAASTRRARRSASILVDDGSLTPALTTTTRNGRWSVLVMVSFSRNRSVNRRRSERRVVRLELVGRVLVRGGAGHVVAAVRVRARLARSGVAVLGRDERRVRGRLGGLRVLAGLGLLA